MSQYRRAKRTDPETSHEAAAGGDETRDAAMRDVVLRCHREADAYGLTEYELKLVFAGEWVGPYAVHSPASLRAGLRDEGRIKWNGTWRENPETNRRQRVWVACAEPPPTVTLCPTCGQKCDPEALRGPSPDAAE